MKKTISLFVMAGALLTGSCNKSEILTPTNKRYIYMNYPNDNPVFNFSFVSSPEKSIRIGIPLQFAGHQLTQDLTYAVRVLPSDEASALKEGEEYELPELIFHKGDFRDTLFVTLHKTARMESMMCNMKLQLADNENFLARQQNAIEAEIRVTAQIAQPSWWNEEVEMFYLGKYSDKKFELFSQKIFMGDYGALDESSKRLYALKFKYWLDEQKPPVYEEDGTLMKVAIQG